MDNKLNIESPSSLEELVDRIDPQIYQALKLAVEIGKWENGEPLSKEQVEHCLQAIIAFEARHVKAEDRIGYIGKKPGPAESRTAANQADTISSDRARSDLQ